MDDLTSLLVAAAGGDRDALERFVANGQADVWRFCASMIGASAADDATQETFVRAWRASRSFRGESSARTWLLAIARRVCFDHLRRHRRHESVAFDDGRRSDASPDSSAAHALTDLIGRLEPDRRSAFVLTQVHGLSYQQAAEVCGCPIGTVRSRVARARSDLMAMERAGDGPAAAPSEG